MKQIIVTVLLIANLFGFSCASVKSVTMKVFNYAGAPIHLYWVNNFQKEVEYVMQTKKAIRNNTDASINSYPTHQFQVRFVDSENNDAEVIFTKGEEDETIYVKYDPETNELFVEQITDVDKMLEFFNEELNKCYNENDKLNQLALADCIAESVVDELERMDKTKSVMKYYQEIMGSRLQHYACKDKSFQPSNNTATSKFRYLGDVYEVETFADSEHVKIFKIDDFFTPDDCYIFRQTWDKEHKSLFFKKAFATSAYKFDTPQNPLKNLYAKAAYFLNYKGGLNIRTDEQEPAELLFYSKGTEMQTRCDGDCNGEEFTKGGYVATALFECEAPKLGGEIFFPTANVFLRPRYSSAIFMIYKGIDNHMDEGYSKYGSCPVENGDRFMVKMQFKEGISSGTDSTPAANAQPAMHSSREL